MATQTVGHAPEADRNGWSLVGGLLRHPHAGWRPIAATPASPAALLLGIAAPLAAIGPVARLIHALVFGSGSMGIIQYRLTPVGAVLTALTGWLAAMAAVWLLALAIDLSAPWFGGARDRQAATKVAVFGSSAWWLASGFAVLPAIGFLQVLGLYSMVLLFGGTPMLMHPREERASIQGLAVVATAIAMLVVSLLIPAAIARSSVRPTVETASGRIVVTDTPAIVGWRVTAPAADKSHALAPGTAAAARGQAAVPAASLQALLPKQIGGFIRTTLESQTNLAAGIASSDAKASYVEGTNSFTLTIADAGAPGALATDNSVIAGEINKVTDSGYQRSRVINGVRIIEKWNNADHGGSYSRAVAGRFTIEAQGTAASIDTLKAAVAAIDQTRLAALPR